MKKRKSKKIKTEKLNEDMEIATLLTDEELKRPKVPSPAQEYSFLRFLYPPAQAHFKAAMKKYPDLAHLDQEEFETIAKDTYGYSPSNRDRMLRRNLWNEVARLESIRFTTGRCERVNNEAVVGTVHKQSYTVQLWKNPLRLLFFMCPVTSIVTLVEEQHERATRTVSDILDLPNHIEYETKKGKVSKLDHRLIELKVKIWDSLDRRLHGDPVKRTQDLTARKPQGRDDPKATMDNLLDELRQLQKRDRMATIEVESKVKEK